MKYFLPTLLSLISIGCIVFPVSLGHLDMLRTENRQNLGKLKIGMTKQEALHIMGEKTATDTFANKETVTATNPYKSEVRQQGGKSYEIYYYYTDIKHQTAVDAWGWSQPSPILEDELTPLVFYDGKLMGWGWSFLKGN